MRSPSKSLVNVQRAKLLELTGSRREGRAMYDALRDLLPFPAKHPAWMAVLTQLVELIRGSTTPRPRRSSTASSCRCDRIRAR